MKTRKSTILLTMQFIPTLSSVFSFSFSLSLFVSLWLASIYLGISSRLRMRVDIPMKKDERRVGKIRAKYRHDSLIHFRV